MRAVVVDRKMEPHELEVREIEAPGIGADQVRIEVRAAGCNFSDVLMLRGEYQVKPPHPFVPGGEVGGVVREVSLSCVVNDYFPAEACVGKWVLVHVGFAMSIIDEKQAAETLAALEELGEVEEELEAMRSSGLA